MDENDINHTYGLVIYSDGGARPNPGFGGYGIHGYYYVAQNPTKGCGLGSIVATSKGYLDKSNKDIKTITDVDEFGTALELNEIVNITPVEYIDVVKSFEPNVTNNACEASGIIDAYELAIQKQVKYLHILSDSKYALNGANEYVDVWERNNWIKSDGNVISNLEIWKKLKELKDTLILNGISITYEWIEGHEGHIGNECADTLATIGVMMSMSGKYERTEYTSFADGYWKREFEHSPMLNGKYCYFNTHPTSKEPGKYFLSNGAGDEEEDGKKISDGGLSVVKLEKADNLIENLQRIQANYSCGADSIFTIYLDKLFNPDVQYYLNKYNDFPIEKPKGYRLDLKFLDRNTLTRERKPAGLIRRTISALTELNDLLDKFNANSADIICTDITDVFYEITNKTVRSKKGEQPATQLITKLRPEIVVGLSSQKIDVNLPFGNDKQAEINLAIGIDILDRNSLKKLESTNPRINVITWEVSPVAFKYATIITAGNDIGIWAGVHSNLRIIT